MATKFAPVIKAASIIDRLGEIKAQIADLQTIERELTDKIKLDAATRGETEYDGEWFRATVITVADRESLDPKAAEAKLRELGVDGRWFSKHQKVTRGYVSVRIAARKNAR
jgi:hypothetical protein